MTSFSVLITGCSRGIGLELVKQFLKKDPVPHHLFATARNTMTAGGLTELAASNENLHLIQLDVTNYKYYPETVNKVSQIVGDDGLNLLINNAGVMPQNIDLESVTPEDMRKAFEVNCVAPLFMTKAMLPLIKQAAQTNAEKPIGIHKAAIIQMSSDTASFAEPPGIIQKSSDTEIFVEMGGFYAYRCSKAALNMAMKSLSVDLAGTNILEMSMHPGWVSTDMGGSRAPVSTETSCSTMLNTLEGLTEKDHGSWLGYDNTKLQW